MPVVQGPVWFLSPAGRATERLPRPSATAGGLHYRRSMARRRRDAPPPASRPLQEVAAEARVLARAVDGLDPADPAAGATVLAYDAALVELCAMLEIPERMFAERRRGQALSERARVEALVQEAGVRLR